MKRPGLPFAPLCEAAADVKHRSLQCQQRDDDGYGRWEVFVDLESGAAFTVWTAEPFPVWDNDLEEMREAWNNTPPNASSTPPGPHHAACTSPHAG